MRVDVKVLKIPSRDHLYHHSVSRSIFWATPFSRLAFARFANVHALDLSEVTIFRFPSRLVLGILERNHEVFTEEVPDGHVFEVIAQDVFDRLPSEREGRMEDDLFDMI